MKIMNDRDVMAIPARTAVAVMEEVFRERSMRSFISPPRMHMDSPDGKIVFTSGGSLSEHVMGFRVYTTFGDGVIDLRFRGSYECVHKSLSSDFCFSLMFFFMLLKLPEQLLRCPSRDKNKAAVCG